MKKFVKFFKYTLLSIVTLCLCFLVYSFFALPDEIYKVPDEKININSIYSLDLVTEEVSENDVKRLRSVGNYKVNVSFLNAIPIKSVNMTVTERKYVVVSGEIFGLRLFTNGVLVVSTDEVESENGKVNPAENAGIKVGDVLISINGEKITSCLQVSDIFASNAAKTMEIEYQRNETLYKTSYNLAYSKSQGKYIAGLWIRDSAAGIGTMTFYDSETGVYGGLGHGVCDVDTGSILPLYNGDIVKAKISGCYKGKSGEAGELCGTFIGGRIGSLNINLNCGVYGILDSADKNQTLTPVALSSEIKTGKAYIYSTVDSSGVKIYEAEIEKLDLKDSQNRNMIIKITDKELLEKTGGIVQGMSGSPIVQNGMLVGAVTHVFVNDSTRGYGIFIGNMLQKLQ